MADDKVEMPADGTGTHERQTDQNGELASRRDGHSGGMPNAGESGGGAYPNPHSDTDDGHEGGFLGHGGQSHQGYYGKGQLGEKDVGDSENAVSTEE
ncbi:MAG: hypothetical protein ACJ8EY_09075 [Sphingomicrobium sp.]